MSFFDCVAADMNDGLIDRKRGERAQAMWTDRRELYRRQGRAEDMADYLAGEDVKAAFTKEAGEMREKFLAQRAAMRKSEAVVDRATDLGTLGAQRVEQRPDAPNQGIQPVSQQVDGLFRLFMGRMAQFADHHSKSMLTGKVKDRALLDDVGRELYSQPTGNATAAMLAKTVRDTFEDMRRMANEAGARIGRLDDWGTPHSHNWMEISRAGFNRWFEEISPRIAWHRMQDNMTGRPMAPEGSAPPRDVQERFLRRIYDERAYGKGSDQPVYGRADGENLANSLSHERVLHFRDYDAWMEYNRMFGTGDVYTSITNHMRTMAEDIVTLREFGPNWRLGLDYEAQIAVAKARKMGDEALAAKIKDNYDVARRMMSLRRGGTRPKTLGQAQRAQFFSTTRTLVQSAILDKAIIANMADMNTMRVTAKAHELDQGSVLKTHMNAMFDSATKQDLRRMNRIAEHLFNPGSTVARFSAEVPPKEIAETISNAVFYYQGLTGWTEAARNAFQLEWAGKLADFAGRNLDQVDEPYRSIMRQRGITDDDWMAFSDPNLRFVAHDGADFMDPLYWREVTTLDPARADDIFLKFQTIAEELTEQAVPTKSLEIRARITGDQTPGTAGYEMMKSAEMVKSFIMSYTINQYRAIMATEQWRVLGMDLTGNAARWARAGDLAVGATLMGAMVVQIGEVLNGRDPSDMTNLAEPDFWARAALRGGGFAVIGDLIATGEASWGGGFASWVMGPMPDLLGDTWALTAGNAFEAIGSGYGAAQGKEWQPTNFGRELVNYLDRWTPGTDIPYVGLALDRLLWDRMMLVVDPDAAQYLATKAQRRESMFNTDHWWSPGSVAPDRAPSVGAAFGQ